jgi:hypothetical protein
MSNVIYLVTKLLFELFLLQKDFCSERTNEMKYDDYNASSISLHQTHLLLN